MEINDLTGEVIGAAIEVHKALGPGLLESIYEECLCMELDLREIPYEKQQAVPIYPTFSYLRSNLSGLWGMMKSCDSICPRQEVSPHASAEFAALRCHT